MTNDVNGVITAAKSFIQSHLVSLNTPTINAGVTPRLYLWGKCYFLNPPSHIPNIAANALGYILYWKSKGANICWGGGCYGSGTNGKPTSSIPSDTDFFFRNGSWDGVMCYGTEITIHEVHHMFECALAKRGYPTAKSKATHVYGKTVPHLDYMSAFGFGFREDKKFTAWAYEQITGTMLSQLSTTVGIAIYNGEITPPPPPPPPPPEDKITKAGIISELGKSGAIDLSKVSTSLGREKWYRFRGRLNYDAAGLNMAISLLNTNARNPPTKTSDISLSENRRSVNELDRTWVQGALAKLPYGAAPPPPPPPPEKKKVTFDSTPAGASVSVRNI